MRPPALSPAATANSAHKHRPSRLIHVAKAGSRTRTPPAIMASADGAPDAAAKPPLQPSSLPPYAPPLAADARVVVEDASLGVSAQVLGERLAHRRYLATFDRLVRFTRPRSSSAGAATAAGEQGGSGNGSASQAAAPSPAGADEDAQQHHDVSYDVIGHPRCEFRFAVVFPYHPPKTANAANANAANANDEEDDEGEVTLVREYAHGPHRFVYSLPSGQFERDKHGEGGLLATARAELEEEARLEGGEWHPLLPPGHPGIPEVKWCANSFEPFLCVDPQPHPDPPARDGEEEAAGLEAVRVPLREFKRLAATGEVLLPSVATGWMAVERLRELGLLGKSKGR